MKDLVIFGAGDIAQLAHVYFTQDSPRRVAAFTVDAAYRQAESFMGLPLVPFEELPARFPPDRYDAFVALSYAKLNRLRAEKCAALRALGYRLASYVSSRATVFGDLTAGDNAFILEDNTIQPFVRIGDNVTLWSGNHIGHHSVIEDDVFIASHVVVSGGVRIGQGCFIGVNATLRDHITLGPRCVVGAGALLLADAEAEGVYMGQATERARVPSSRLRGI
ncbi:acetyltransferase [Rubritepida flocculans]|uniref:acetyltransferase n=1 Tax=Rubritepida flocculans TaxID=182403 RepID=UPI000489023B|nr:acetyltransferase [Rubritepida flocculans]